MHNTIRFLLDGEVVSIQHCDPTRTVLQFLREDRQRLGSKEGCAEGDCGACTVVLATPNSDGTCLRYQAVNSCIQFLPTLDGKELITVESLVGRDGELHPVQQAMVECHGSQCGFCTPGFVMSLFAMYKNQSTAERTEIDRALAGNLCRCTGYRPIIDAAAHMYVLGQALPPSGRSRLNSPGTSASHNNTSDGPQDPEAAKVIRQLYALKRTGTLHVTAGNRQYFAPVNVTDLAALVGQYPDATLVAGGTDVGLWVTKDHRELDVLIYVSGVAELTRIEQTPTNLEIGAAVTLSDVMPVLLAHYPDLEEMLVRFAAPPVRNAGTLGGNVANGSPIGDSMPALIALGAQITLRRGAAQRRLPLEEFYQSYGVNSMQSGEFLERVHIPRPAPAQVFRCYKLSKRFDEDISAVCMAIALTLEQRTVAAIRIGCGGLGEIPKRARACEQALLGKPWNEATVTTAMAVLNDEFTPISDMRASAAYRRTAMQNLLLRFFIESSDAQEDTRVYNFAR